MGKATAVNRRDFVKTAGTATAATAALWARLKGSSANDTTGRAINYGFIGTGSRGARLLERHLSKIGAGRCIAICDTYEPNREKGMQLMALHNPRPYSSHRELLQQQDLQAVFIATPLFTHYPIIKDALQAGKHVFCEKSLVFRPEEIHGLRALHKEHPNLIIQVGLQRRYSSFYRSTKEMVEKGLIGKVTHIYAQWHRNQNWRRAVTDPKLEEQINWRLYRRYSGGLAAELMSHQVDVANWMIGATPVSVTGVGGLDYWKDGRDIYDNIQLIFEYPKGEKLTYSAIGTNRHIQGRRLPGDGCREVIMGTDGTIEITLLPSGEGMWFVDVMPEKIEEALQRQEEEQWTAGATVAELDWTEESDGRPIIPGFRELESLSPDEREAERARRSLYQEGLLRPTEDRDPEYKQLERFLLDVRDGGTPAADVEVGLEDSIAVILANRCMDKRRTVYFNELA